MKTYEDEAFDELEKSLQRKVATGVTNGSNGYGGVERMRVGANGITWRGPDGEITMRLDDAGLRIAKPLNADGNKKDDALRLAREFIEDVYLGEWRGPTERQEEVIKAIDEALEDK